MSKVRIAIDFKSLEDARTWLIEAIDAGILTHQGDAFPMDALDRANNAGITMKHTWIFRNRNSRPNGMLHKAASNA